MPILRKDLYVDYDGDYAIRPENIALVMGDDANRIFGRLLLPYAASIEERVPIIVMLHGFPGSEQNIDIAQALRRAGIAVVTFSYRGVWGSHGYYSLSHIIEDTLRVIDFIRDYAEEYRLDTHSLYLIGHSMGGFAALNAIARGARVRGAILIAPCDIAYKYFDKRESYLSLLSEQSEGYFNIPSSSYIEGDVIANAYRWRFTELVNKLDPSAKYSFIGGRFDDLTPPEEHIEPMLGLMRSRGLNVEYALLDDGHSFPSSRIKLTELIADYLMEMEKNNE